MTGIALIIAAALVVGLGGLAALLGAGQWPV